MLSKIPTLAGPGEHILPLTQAEVPENLVYDLSMLHSSVSTFELLLLRVRPQVSIFLISNTLLDHNFYSFFLSGSEPRQPYESDNLQRAVYR